MSETSVRFSVMVMLAAAALAGCSTQAGPDLSHADIANIKNIRSSFPPQFTVTDTGPTGVDPQVFAPQTLPAGITFDPPECAEFATSQAVPEGTKGNMAAVTAEGDGNRFIVIAVETSKDVLLDDTPQNCQKVGYQGAGLRGMVETVDAPAIDGAHTRGVHRVVQTVGGDKQRTGELYNYVASFGTFLVMVTANPLVVPDKPTTAVDTQRARDLLTAGVTAVKG